jgi:hypothetical protein
MLTDLKAWEAYAPEGAPRLLLVSTNSVESNQAMGLRLFSAWQEKGSKARGTYKV